MSHGSFVVLVMVFASCVWCGVVLVLTTLSQLLELDCVLECHTGLCEIFSDHYLLSVKKSKGIFD
jgi:hypothetical protein